jgi:hypothetical protein
MVGATIRSASTISELTTGGSSPTVDCELASKLGAPGESNFRPTPDAARYFASALGNTKKAER